MAALEEIRGEQIELVVVVVDGFQVGLGVLGQQAAQAVDAGDDGGPATGPVLRAGDDAPVGLSRPGAAAVCDLGLSDAAVTSARQAGSSNSGRYSKCMVS